MKALIVEDDPRYGAHLNGLLERDGFLVDWEQDADLALEKGFEEGIAIIILDLMLSSKNGPYERAVDGLSLLRRWRKKGVATPILVLTASRTDIEDTTVSYAWDADYEIKRPGAEFDSLLLAWARSRSARKAVGGGSDGPKFIERGGLFINRDLREARFNGTLLDLSQTEYNVLMCLIKAGDQWSSIHDIAAGAFGAGCDNPNAQTYEYVKRLRQKLGFSAIRNQRGRGYRLCLAPAED